MLWGDGGFPSFSGCVPHPGRAGGAGNKGPFESSQRMETTLYLMQNPAGQMGPLAQLGEATG